MSWRFRRSFKVIPGVRLNLSKSGVSCSIGGAPFTVNVGPRGALGRVAHPSFFEGWDSTDASIMGFRVPLHNAARRPNPPWGRPFPSLQAQRTLNCKTVMPLD